MAINNDRLDLSRSLGSEPLSGSETPEAGHSRLNTYALNGAPGGIILIIAEYLDLKDPNTFI